MAQTDKFRKVKSLFSTTLQSGIGTGTGDTITLGSATGLPTDTEITLTFDRVDSNGSSLGSQVERITGTISGNTLTNYTRAIDSTTEQAHSAGAVIEYIPNADDTNDMIDGILAEHDQDGTHGAITPTSVVMGGAFDAAGNLMDLDADNDTSITADTDDRIDIEVGGSDRFRLGTSDIDIVTATGNIQVAAADPWRTVSIFGGMKPTTTSGCAAKATIEAGTNDIDYDVLAFDASSDERAFVNFRMPTSWNGGVIQFQYVWTNAGGSSSQTVAFELSARAFADGDAVDQAVGTPVEVSDTWQAQGDVHISDWSGDITVAGSPAGGQWVHFEIMRDVSQDDMTGDARLIDVNIRYRQGQFSD